MVNISFLCTYINTYSNHWDHDSIVMSWEQAKNHLFLICIAAQINTGVFVISVFTHIANEKSSEIYLCKDFSWLWMKKASPP